MWGNPIAFVCEWGNPIQVHIWGNLPHAYIDMQAWGNPIANVTNVTCVNVTNVT